MFFKVFDLILKTENAVNVAEYNNTIKTRRRLREALIIFIIKEQRDAEEKEGIDCKGDERYARECPLSVVT